MKDSRPVTTAEASYAGIVSRSAANVIDLLVVLAVMGVFYVGMILARLAFSPRAFTFPSPSVVFSALGLAAVAVLYLAACWAVSGCTAGAVVMGLRVVGRQSRPLRAPLAVARAIAYVVFPIGFAWVVIDRQRRSLQDIAFGSRVIYTRLAASTESSS